MPPSILGQPLAHQRNLEPPQGVTHRSQELHGGSGTTTLLDYPRLSAPLGLPADCLIASDLDSASEAEVERDFQSSSERELNEVHPPSSYFQDMTHNPSMRVAYRDLVPMTRLFSTQLPICEGDWRCLTNFVQGEGHPPGPAP